MFMETNEGKKLALVITEKEVLCMLHVCTPKGANVCDTNEENNFVIKK